MDFNELDTKALMTKGLWLHLRSPKGDPLYADEEKTEKAEVLVYGIDSERAQKAVRGVADAQRVMAAGGPDDRSIDELEAQGVAFVLEIVGDIRGVIVDGERVTASRDDLRAFFTRFTWAADQVCAVFKNRGKYLENA